MSYDARKLCVTCAWRGTCQVKYSMPGGVALHCPEYTRDVTLTEPAEEVRKRNVVVVGAHGIGKTAFVKRVLQRVDLRAGGYLQREVKSGLFRTSQELVLLDGGPERVVRLTDGKAWPGWMALGKRYVNLDGLDNVVVPHLQAAVLFERTELIVLDEIGRPHCLSERFRRQVVDCLTSSKSVLATVGAAEDDEFIYKLLARADVTVLHITYDNPDSLADQVAFLLTGERPGVMRPVVMTEAR